MLKHLFCLALLATLAFAAPPMDHDPIDEHDVLHPETVVGHMPVVEILESGTSHQPDGSYHFHFRGEDGSFREETAVMRHPGTKNAYLDVNGAYSYFDVNGKEVIVHYKAGKKGFVPQGGDIPEVVAEAAKRNSELPPYVEKPNHNMGPMHGVGGDVVVMPTMQTMM